MILIYTVFKNKEEAQRVARIILEKKMALCANMWEISSMYWWEGKIVDNEEVVAIFKTLKQNYSRLKKEIKENHSYQAPLIASIKVNEVDGDFYAYLKKTVKKYYGKKSVEAKPNLKNKEIKKGWEENY